MRGYQFGAAIELIDDLEYHFLSQLGRRVRYEQPADAQMFRGAQAVRNERVGGLTDPVMKEFIGMFHAEDEASLDRFRKLLMHFLARLLRNHHEQVEFHAVAQAGE